MNEVNITPEEEKRAKALEEKFGISRQEILEDSYIIENDIFDKSEIIEVVDGDEFRARYSN